MSAAGVLVTARRVQLVERVHDNEPIAAVSDSLFNFWQQFVMTNTEPAKVPHVQPAGFGGDVHGLLQLYQPAAAKCLLEFQVD